MHNPNFDRYPHIRYTDLTTLFWGEFPYKISIDLPVSSRRSARSPEDLRRRRDRLLDQIDFNYREVEFRARPTGYSFFFTDGGVASEFIDSNHQMVSEVVRPFSEREIEILRDCDICLRNDLFLGRYAWRVSFDARPWLDACARTSECDEFVTGTFFGEDTNPDEQIDRASYSWGTSSRKLYLSQQSDVILTKLSVSERVTRVEQAVLRCDI